MRWASAAFVPCRLCVRGGWCGGSSRLRLGFALGLLFVFPAFLLLLHYARKVVCCGGAAKEAGFAAERARAQKVQENVPFIDGSLYEFVPIAVEVHGGVDSEFVARLRQWARWRADAAMSDAAADDEVLRLRRDAALAA